MQLRAGRRYVVTLANSLRIFKPISYNLVGNKFTVVGQVLRLMWVIAYTVITISYNYNHKCMLQ